MGITPRDIADSHSVWQVELVTPRPLSDGSTVEIAFIGFVGPDRQCPLGGVAEVLAYGTSFGFELDVHCAQTVSVRRHSTLMNLKSQAEKRHP